MKYFTNVASFEELKIQYRRLAMQYHPDRGGSLKIMQTINAEHDAIFENLIFNNLRHLSIECQKCFEIR